MKVLHLIGGGDVGGALLAVSIVLFCLAAETSHKRAAPRRTNPRIIVAVGNCLAKEIISLCIGDTPGKARAENRPSSHNANRDNHLLL